MSYLELKNLSKDFDTVRALSGVDLEIEEGTFCVVLGPSGCGKSTLLNLIAGLEEPSSGKIYLGGRDITGTPPHQRNIAMVFQNYALYPHLSVFENMAFSLRVKGLEEDRIKERLRDVSRILNIEDKLSKFPRELSGGEQQRVATGRAIVREPDLFLFDEPLSNLDARLRVELRGEFIKLHRRLKKTVIYVTHDQLEAMVLGKLVVVIKDGEIQQVSAPRELYHDPRNLFVAGFIGTPPMNIERLKVMRLDRGLALTRGSFTLQIPRGFRQRLEEYRGQEICFGFRPTAAKVIRGGELAGAVVFTETIGEDNYARIRLGEDIEVNVKTESDLRLKSGESVPLTIDSARMFFFDGSGNRI